MCQKSCLVTRHKFLFMNSKPLPKPTPTQPTNNNGVVFDQSQQKNDSNGAKPLQKNPAPNQSGENTTSADTSKIPLAQKTPPTSPAPTSPAGNSSNTTPTTNVPNSTFDQSKSNTQVSPPPKPGSTPLPPTSLSALSSMNSNVIPGTPTQAQNQPQPVQKTVLGRPLPQTMRGEATPTGLSATPAAPKPQSVAPIPVVPTPQTSPKPTASINSNIKTENPAIGDKNSNNGSTKPKIATAKSPVMKFLPFIVGGAVLILLIVFILSKVFGGSSSTSVADNTAKTANPTADSTTKNPSENQQRQEVPAQRVTVDYWGLWEPSEVMDEVISDFESENPGIVINYVKQSHVDYRERLQTAVQSGSGPDLFRFHASWVPMLKSVLDPIPATVASSSDFQGNYYPVVTDQLVSQGQYVGLPLMYDGLVLYYNEDILDTAGETPPKTWPELRALAVKLTVPSANGIERGGLAIGNATNVEHFSDILASLILQNGGNLAEADSVETRDALLFYTNFQEKDKVWNETLPSSTVAFARGDVAMMFAPSWRAHEIQALNPDLKFATTTLPQLSEDEPITWASYWAEGISAQSDSKSEAATFLAYLNRDDVLQKFYSNASEVRAFGEIYPKVSMSEQLQNNTVVSSILEDAVFAESWYLNSYTHDNGINDQMISYYKTAVTSILNGEKTEDVQELLKEGVTQVLKQYGVSTK